jgi:protein TonB
MSLGIAIPIAAARRIPVWALGLSLATHLAVLFWPAIQRPDVASDTLPPLAVSFRTPVAPAPAVVESAALLPRVLPPVPPPVVRAPSPRTSVLAVAPAGGPLAETVAASPVPPPVLQSEAAAPARVAVEASPAVLAVDQAAMARYIRLLGDLLAQQQQYPRLAAARGWEGEVRLRLQVARKGTIIAVHILHSSGFDVLDQHAVQLVQGTTLPPPSSSGTSPDFMIDVPILYSLKRSS